MFNAAKRWAANDLPDIEPFVSDVPFDDLARLPWPEGYSNKYRNAYLDKLLIEPEAVTKESFGNAFRDACKAAGLPGSAQGVRKLAATRMANNGATEAQLMECLGGRTRRWLGTTRAVQTGSA